ncbi:MAG: hypothetical protein DRR16_09335 [Candidatus Parabeggiatoa sp. nov. 3]|nr:MAG: hypothetical protein DRR00_21350 [Gammaproteobacteria bacterium]RKZ64777.1 MAG: hypothetical protein DRQ99_14675 [Gammaproteobacteria bacterium]RKZ86567.1 MAG: hypothetical protein DRR16_09335 [Gammaproteobacteria bacterium]
MKKLNTEMDDDLRSEYDLSSLRVRKVGPERKSFGGSIVQLEPDVAEVFPSSESVNEVLRFLIRVTREQKLAFTTAKGNVSLPLT